MVYTVGTTTCQDGPVNNWLLEMLAAGRISEQEINDLINTYGGNTNAWVNGSGLYGSGIFADDILNLESTCVGQAGYPQPPRVLSTWKVGTSSQRAIDTMIPVPTGFVHFVGFQLVDLATLDPNVQVRCNEQEYVTQTGKLDDKIPGITAKLVADAQARGATVVGVEWLRRRDRRVVPRNWEMPSIFTANPIYHSFFDGQTTFEVPFGGDVVQDVDVWRCRVIEDLGALGIIGIVLVVALVAFLAVDFFQTRSLDSTEHRLGDVLHLIQNFIKPLTPAGTLGAAIPPLFLLAIGGGLITIALMMTAQKGGLQVGTFVPPQLPAPSSRVRVQAGPVTGEAGFGGSSGGGGGAARRAAGRR